MHDTVSVSVHTVIHGSQARRCVALAHSSAGASAKGSHGGISSIGSVAATKVRRWVVVPGASEVSVGVDERVEGTGFGNGPLFVRFTARHGDASPHSVGDDVIIVGGG